MNGYSELFEYAGQLVRNHIDNEIVLAMGDPESLFGESSWQSNFFGFNIGLLNNPLARDQVKKMLDAEETEQRPYNAALARVTSLYIDLVVGCGKDHVDKMIENCTKAINSLSPATTSGTDDPVATIMKYYPILIVSALGNPYFISKKIAYLKKKQITTTLSSGSQK